MAYTSEQGRENVLAAIKSDDPIGGLLPDRANSFRLDVRQALQDSRASRLGKNYNIGGAPRPDSTAIYRPGAGGPAKIRPDPNGGPIGEGGDAGGLIGGNPVRQPSGGRIGAGGIGGGGVGDWSQQELERAGVAIVRLGVPEPSSAEDRAKVAQWMKDYAKENPLAAATIWTNPVGTVLGGVAKAASLRAWSWLKDRWEAWKTKRKAKKDAK